MADAIHAFGNGHGHSRQLRVPACAERDRSGGMYFSPCLRTEKAFSMRDALFTLSQEGHRLNLAHVSYVVQEIRQAGNSEQQTF